jgi:hypothetical protein
MEIKTIVWAAQQAPRCQKHNLQQRARYWYNLIVRISAMKYRQSPWAGVHPFPGPRWSGPRENSWHPMISRKENPILWLCAKKD